MPPAKKIFSFLVSCCAASIATADRFYVSDDAAPGGDGSSWNTAFQFLQDALDQTVADRGDEIWLEAGVYYPDDGASVDHEDREATFTLKAGVTILGGFAGDEVNINPRDPVTNESILSGEIFAGEANKEFWSLHVVTVVGAATLDGLIIEKGNANGDVAPFDSGGGVYASGASVSILLSTLRNNAAKLSGGAVVGDLIASDSVFADNSSEVGGAAQGTINIDGCTFENNSAIFGGAIDGFGMVDNSLFDSNSAFRGGATHATNNTVRIDFLNSTFRDNTASELGGSHYGRVTADNCVFEDNAASFGGAIRTVGISNIEDTVFRDNSATQFGGAHYGQLDATDCLFENNTAVQGGANYGETTADNCQFVGNSADFGGAVRGRAVATQCVFENNSATDSGGAIWGDGATGSEVDDTIFILNTAVDSGGAVLGKVDAINSIFIQNGAGTGGGIYLESDSSLRNCLVLDNTASLDQAGGSAFVSVGATLFLFNSVLSGGLANSLANEIAGSGTLRDSEIPEDPPFPNPGPPEPNHIPNLIEGGLSIVVGVITDFGSDLITESPDFVDANEPLGPDLAWRTQDDGLRPEAGGNLVNAGGKDAVLNDTEKDLGGLNRVQGGEVDIGAYEFWESVTLAISVSPESTGVIFDSGNGAYDRDATATIAVTPSLGYLFEGWGGDATGDDDPLELLMDENKDITAFFIQDSSDVDGDGLSRFDELITHGTNPNDFDTSGDGFSDGDVVARGLDPTQDYSGVLSIVQAAPASYGLFSSSDVEAAKTITNVSTRVFLRDGEVIVPGFVVLGDSKRLLIRAVGPKLADIGVVDPLPDPTMAIYQSRFDGNPPDLVDIVDDWKEGGADVAALNDAMASVGAFPLEPTPNFQGNPMPTDDTESAAVLLTLSTGVYTIVVTTGDDQPGEVLVEVYEITE